MKIKNMIAGMGLATVILATSIAPSTVKAAVGKTPAFDPDYYASRYWDLKGMNADEAHKHFMTYGLKEGRSSSPVFDVKLYKELNWDLAGLTNEQAYNHFINYGMKEGRKTSIVFDADYYSKSYWEGSISKKDTYMDFINNGLKEGRASSLVFDVDFYRSYNWDLRNMTNEQAYIHFLTYGIKEGRQTTAGFNVKAYKANYWDLANMSYEQLYKHYITYGRYEKRVPSNIYVNEDLTELVKSRYGNGMKIVSEIENYALKNGNGVPENFVDKRILSDTFTKQGWEAFKEYAGIMRDSEKQDEYNCWSMQYVPSDATKVEVTAKPRKGGEELYGYVYLTYQIASLEPNDVYRTWIYELQFKQENDRWLIDNVGEVGWIDPIETDPDEIAKSKYEAAIGAYNNIIFNNIIGGEDGNVVTANDVNNAKDLRIFTQKGWDEFIEYVGLTQLDNGNYALRDSSLHVYEADDVTYKQVIGGEDPEGKQIICAEMRLHFNEGVLQAQDKLVSMTLVSDNGVWKIDSILTNAIEITAPEQ